MKRFLLCAVVLGCGAGRQATVEPTCKPQPPEAPEDPAIACIIAAKDTSAINACVLVVEQEVKARFRADEAVCEKALLARNPGFKGANLDAKELQNYQSCESEMAAKTRTESGARLALQLVAASSDALAQRAVKEARDATDRLTEIDSLLVGTKEMFGQAIGDVVDAENDTDRANRNQRLKRLEVDLGGMRDHAIAAKAATTLPPVEHGPIHIQLECKDNPLARGCP